MADELLDLVDNKDNIIGTVWKSVAHGDPNLIHREIAVAVYNDLGEVLIQQRSNKKLKSPGEWKISAAGHIVYNEKPENAAKREVKEELGLNIRPIFFEKVYKQDLRTDNLSESRFFYIYYALIKGRPSLKLDKEEVNDAKWIPFSDLYEKDPYNIGKLSFSTIIKIAKFLKLI